MPPELDELSTLLNDIETPLAERISMGRFATHLVRATIQTQRAGGDSELLGFLLSRWDFGLQDPDGNVEDVLEPFEIYPEDASWILGKDLGEIRAGIARLNADGVIHAIPNDACVLVTFRPVVERLTSKLAQRAYRDFYVRHGRILLALAEDHLAVIEENLADEEARKDRPRPRLGSIRSALASIGATPPREVFRSWTVTPQLMYQWLDRLTVVETELAIVSGHHSLGLGHALHTHRHERIMILSEVANRENGSL